MNIKIVDSKLRIASASYAEIKAEFGEKATTVFVYCPTRDLILLNEDCGNFETWKDLLQIYMGLEDWQKREFYKAEFPDSVKKCMKVADKIMRIRRKRGAAA